MAFMTHPIHGATNVGSGEIAEHEANGWKLSTHEEWISQKVKPAKVEPEDEPKKRGRPFTVK